MTRPILWWSGDNTVTESQAGVDATWKITPNYAAGKVGNSFRIGPYFDYSDWGLSVPNNALFNFAPTGSFSYRFWLKLNTTSYTADSFYVLKSPADWGIYKTQQSLVIEFNSSSYNTDGIINDLLWHDILVTYANGYWHVYIDSIDVSGTYILNNQLLCSNTTGILYFGIGGSYISVDYQLDEIRIYDAAISVDNDDLSDSIRFVSGSNRIWIRKPDFGYTVEIHMPIHSVEKHPAGYAFFDCDATAASDYRILSGTNWLLTEAEKYEFNNFLKNADLGRGENFTLSLGNTPTGFFPFGPDYGDVGDFTVRLLEQEQSGSMYSPRTYFRDELKLILVTPPSYVAAAGLSQGGFQIGTVSGLMPPQIDIASNTQYNYTTLLTRTGSPHTMDGCVSGDYYSTAFEVWANDGKAASLISHLQGTVRTNDVSIIAGDNYYIFGMNNGSEGSYNTKFLGSEMNSNEIIISVKHERYNRWIIPISFSLIEINTRVLEFESGVHEFETGVHEL